MSAMIWEGVMPAITTPFHAEDLTVDHEFLARHCRWLIENGSTGIVPGGSLGEGATLDPDERLAIIETCVAATEGRVPVMPGIAASSTAQACEMARRAEAAGARALMVLPPYVHNGQWPEHRTHFEAILDATNLPCMLYNNPHAYGIDIRPEQIAGLVEAHPNLEAVKESSGDVRRITGIRALVGDRLRIFVGLDDAIVEGIDAGAVGWIAGLVNALPQESVELFRRARAGEKDRAFELYRWFLPLLRLDTVPEFVQLIKLVQQEVGMGTEVVRPPRQPVEGARRELALATIRHAIAENPLTS